ncbi:hypothetical protein [Microbacterium sp. 5K110]|uniref:hypothetical protein n=1 Tax=unclassified Microbacterium TaxID=2609290 RepID=UPI0010FE2A9E|nr:hypothetical protein [Microbacterium sp. 5K110]TLF33952.1 hypothetical protein FE256_02220 [Microbacterium sp. 5K110]
MTSMRRLGGTKKVAITPGPEKPGRAPFEAEALVQPESIFFEVDVPIYNGDRMEWDDPRGGRESAYASQVDVRDQGSSRIRHIEVKYSAAPPAPEPPAPQGGHVIVVNGSHVNIAVDGSTVTQQLPVAAGYEHLADAVGRALALIEKTMGIDPEEVDVAREYATLIVAETAKPNPDQKVLKRLIPALKGVLASAANAGAGAAASGLIGQLFVGS